MFRSCRFDTDRDGVISSKELGQVLRYQTNNMQTKSYTAISNRRDFWRYWTLSLSTSSLSAEIDGPLTPIGIILSRLGTDI
jgi:hypothetical protein